MILFPLNILIYKEAICKLGPDVITGLSRQEEGPDAGTGLREQHTKAPAPTLCSAARNRPPVDTHTHPECLL